MALMMLGGQKCIQLSHCYLNIYYTLLKCYISPGIHEIPAGRNTLGSEVHKLINFIWNKEESLQQWEESIIIPIDKTDCSKIRGI
jgi:hypothetical protein